MNTALRCYLFWSCRLELLSKFKTLESFNSNNSRRISLNRVRYFAALQIAPFYFLNPDIAGSLSERKLSLSGWYMTCSTKLQQNRHRRNYRRGTVVGRLATYEKE